MTAHAWNGENRGECLLRIECLTVNGPKVEWWHVEWKDYDCSEGPDHNDEQLEGYYTVGSGEFAGHYGMITHWAPLPEVEL